jgi:hypothetical protein
VDHAVWQGVEADALGVFDGDVEGFEHEVGAAEVDGVAGVGVDHFHERGLDGLLVLDEGDGWRRALGGTWTPRIMRWWK